MLRICLIAVATLVLNLSVGVVCASAQNTISFISFNGSNANNCTQADPCNSLSGALAKTNANGTITCLDQVIASNAALAAITISKSINVDCSEHPLRIVAFGSPVITIAAGASDLVTIQGLRIEYGTTPTGGSSRLTSGISITSAKAVYLDDVVVDNVSQSAISDTRSAGGTRLYINNSTVKNSSGVGILAAATGPSSTVLTNVQSLNNGYGLAIATGNNVIANRSTFSGNATAGVEADGGAQLAVNDSIISHTNGAAVQASGLIRLSNSEVNFNNQAFQGNVITYGNNRMMGNVSMGTTPAPAGSSSPAEGQF